MFFPCPILASCFFSKTQWPANTGVCVYVCVGRRQLKYSQNISFSSCVQVYLSEPLAVHQAGPEATVEGLDPVVSEHHRLREAEVELLLRGPNCPAGPG